MKIFKWVLMLFFGISLIISCNKPKEKHPNQFTLEGEIKGLTGHLYFRHPDKEYTRETPPDTIHVVDGKIKFSDTISNLSLIRAYTDYDDPENKLYKKPADGNGYFPVSSMYFMFFAFPGATISVDGEATDFVNAYPTGDNYNNSLAAINKMVFPNFNSSVNLLVQSTFEKDSLKIKELNKKEEHTSEEGRLARIKHIKEHPNSLGALWYLGDMMQREQIEDSLAIEIFNKVSKDLSELSFYQAVRARVKGITTTAEGMPVPAIKTTATLDSTEFDITALKGKYVLIDFWGIWCGPCVAEMPTVKAFQEKHKDKLVVLGINSGDTKEKIQKFIDDKEYNWQQILSDRRNASNDFVSQFNVKGFPTKFIIDPEGNIVKRYIGSGEEAFQLLETLLKK